MDVPVNAELLRYGPEVQGADAMALLADPVVELEGRLAGLQAKRQRFAQSTLRDATLRDANLRGAKLSKADLSGAKDTTRTHLINREGEDQTDLGKHCQRRFLAIYGTQYSLPTWSR
jgi:hypothetical protein